MKFNTSTNIAAKLPLHTPVTLNNLKASFIHNEATNKAFFRFEGIADKTPYAFTVNIPLNADEPLFPVIPILGQLELFKSYNDTDTICADVNSSKKSITVMLVETKRTNQVTGEESTYENVVCDPTSITKILAEITAAPNCAAPTK